MNKESTTKLDKEAKIFLLSILSKGKITPEEKEKLVELLQIVHNEEVTIEYK